MTILRTIIAILTLCCAAIAHDGPHADDPIKHAEHVAALRLVDPATATQAIGTSSDLTITPTTDLHVRTGTAFVIDGDMDFRRILIDGDCGVTTDACTVRFETLIEGTTGRLVIPESGHVRRLIVKARGPRDRTGDPTDIAGGIILHGKSNLFAGEVKTRVTVPVVIDQSRDLLALSERPLNWHPGDRILIPGVRWTDADEIVAVVKVDGSNVLVEDIVGDHKLSDGTYPAVGNLTCSVVIESESAELSQRGHLMVMHEHTGTTFQHVAFVRMGRTSVESTPTRITLGPDGEFLSGDSNTIGRYPLHFHGRNGAHKGVEPHHVDGCVIEDSPSHGGVNHGSHVSAVGNVVFNCGGSSLFAENGIELGDFTGNLCVLALGRQAPTTPAQRAEEMATRKNFGWEGTTIWLNGPGIDVVGNHCYRAKRALIEMDCEILPDAGGQFSFPVEYIREGPHKQALLAQPNPPATVGVFQVPARFVGNTGAGSRFGMHITRHLYDGNGFDTRGKYPEKTPVHGNRFFNVDSGINGTYLGHLDIRNCRLDGNLKLSTNYAAFTGMPSGTKVHDIAITGCDLRRFQVGVVDRGWSDLTVQDCRFEDCLIDISLIPTSNIKTPHVVVLSRLQHVGRPQMAALYATRPATAVYGKPGDYWIQPGYKERMPALAVEPFLVAPHTLDGRLLYYQHNAAGFVPYADAVETYGGKTNQQLMAESSMCVGGRFFVEWQAGVEPLAGANVPVWIERADEPEPPVPEPLTLESLDARLRRVEEKVGVE